MPTEAFSNLLVNNIRLLARALFSTQKPHHIKEEATTTSMDADFLLCISYGAYDDDLLQICEARKW